jgi:hypothetical protein
VTLPDLYHMYIYLKFIHVKTSQLSLFNIILHNQVLKMYHIILYCFIIQGLFISKSSTYIMYYVDEVQMKQCENTSIYFKNIYPFYDDDSTLWAKAELSLYFKCFYKNIKPKCSAQCVYLNLFNVYAMWNSVFYGYHSIVYIDCNDFRSKDIFIHIHKTNCLSVLTIYKHK